LPGLLQHDPGIAGGHLRSADRIAVAVMFHESEGLAEPYSGFLQVPIPYVRQHRVSWYRAIGYHRLCPPRKDCAGKIQFLLPTTTLADSRRPVL
jgi:hypothetical protein